jgi:hypothetical protein
VFGVARADFNALPGWKLEASQPEEEARLALMPNRTIIVDYQNKHQRSCGYCIKILP